MFAARGTGLARHAICACNQAVLAEVNSIPNGLYLLVRAKLQVDNRQAFLLLTASVRVTLTFYILVRSTFANSAFSQCFSDLVRTTAEETSIQYYDEMADTMTCQQLVSLPCTCLLPDSKHGAQGEASQTVPLSITLLQAVLERLSASMHTLGKGGACPKNAPPTKSVQEPLQRLPEIGQESQSKLCCADFDIQLLPSQTQLPCLQVPAPWSEDHCKAVAWAMCSFAKLMKRATFSFEDDCVCVSHGC